MFSPKVAFPELYTTEQSVSGCQEMLSRKIGLCGQISLENVPRSTLLLKMYEICYWIKDQEVQQYHNILDEMVG